MLTISAPLEIKAKTTYLRDPEAFYHRIVGGYSLMETQISQEDLLHITATPPEIYVAEGEGMTSILNRAERNETNINKVNVLNNVLNRIVASADYQLTYQDRVFITDALYKLGIKDDRRFMEAFYQMTLETRNTNALIDLYLEQGENLKEMVESVESMYLSEMNRTTQLTEREKENYLYSSIMNRLKTGAVYQIVNNFNRTVEENSIDAREYSVSNQTYTAQRMFLSMLRRQSGLPENNLIFLNENTYEESVENEEINVKDVRNEITAAVLLDMLQNIYHTGFDRFYSNNETYYRFEDMFYKAADQLFLRIINNVQSQYLERINSQTVIEESRNLIRNEMELLQRGEEGQLSEEEILRITDHLNMVNLRDEVRSQTTLSLQERERELVSLLTEKNRLSSTEMELLERVKEGQLTEEEILQITDHLDMVNIRDEVRRQSTLSIQDRKRELISLLSEKSNLTESERELIDNISNTQLTSEEINRLYQTINDINTERERIEKQYSSESLTQRQRLENITEREKETEKLTEHLTQIQEGKITEEQIQNLTEAVNRINVENELRRQQYVREIQKIRERQAVEEPSQEGFNQTRKDAALALSNPEKLLQKLEERREKKAKRQNNIINELQQIFPDQSMEVYQILSSLREGDVNLIENNIARPAEIGELMSDINNVNEVVQEIKEEPVKKDMEAQAFIEAVKAARQEEELSSKRGIYRGPAETIHRRSENITAEELNEQLDMMEKNFSKHMNKNVESEVITTNKTEHTTEIRAGESQVNQISARDVQQMITSEMKSQMQAISNQVIGKIERQMKNEKMRRGY